MSICLSCGRVYEYKRGKSCTREKCNTCYISGNRKKRKIIAVNLFGGKCQKCGYNSLINNLSFHHINPTEKELNLSVAHTVSWERYVRELNKCALLCMNCHNECHYGLWNIEEVDRIVLGEDILRMVIPTGRTTRKFLLFITKKCMGCGNNYKVKSDSRKKFCSPECYQLSTRKAIRPSLEQLSIEIKENSWVSLGRKYGVSDNAVKKWARNYNLI